LWALCEPAADTEPGQVKRSSYRNRVLLFNSVDSQSWDDVDWDSPLMNRPGHPAVPSSAGCRAHTSCRRFGWSAWIPDFGMPPRPLRRPQQSVRPTHDGNPM